MRLAIDKLNGTEFKGRQIRIKKAVAPNRLEKKKIRNEEKAKLKAEAKAEGTNKQEEKETEPKEEEDMDK